ncbi:hypothetical protein [Petroclostridium sp. X23]|uniref:hypothetical protein n=1 Tax=Petroclostridium sp. X23 TaxID=3045146 RepID=UPI0024AE5B71|nr:hypothetical protein [Petroclostridium sp. X23]WHH59675.1 hypothetical protein QKW49_02620 [Petroclostridium sp. X23]
MLVSEKLASEIHTIVIFHIAAILFITGFTTYIILKAKKTPLLYSFIAVAAMICLWMFSKILKWAAFSSYTSNTIPVSQVHRLL